MLAGRYFIEKVVGFRLEYRYSPPSKPYCCGRELAKPAAEGATRPETLRQKDRKQCLALESSG